MSSGKPKGEREMKKNAPKKCKALEQIVKGVLKEIRKGKAAKPSVPGTVTAYQAMDNLSNKKNPEEGRLEYQIAASSAAIATKAMGDDIGSCVVKSVKDKPIMGRDPDSPDTITNCGNVFEASVVCSFGKIWVNISCMLEFMTQLELGCGRSAYITDFESKGIDAPLKFTAIFRIGTPAKAAKPVKKARKQVKKAKK